MSFFCPQSHVIQVEFKWHVEFSSLIRLLNQAYLITLPDPSTNAGRENGREFILPRLQPIKKKEKERKKKKEGRETPVKKEEMMSSYQLQMPERSRDSAELASTASLLSPNVPAQWLKPDEGSLAATRTMVFFIATLKSFDCNSLCMLVRT